MDRGGKQLMRYHLFSSIMGEYGLWTTIRWFCYQYIYKQHGLNSFFIIVTITILAVIFFNVVTMSYRWY